MKFEEVTKELEKIYYEKNKKYGNSFKELYDELGPISAVTQILHKSNRLKYIIKKGTYEEVKDTLIDLANYSIMTLMELEKDE